MFQTLFIIEHNNHKIQRGFLFLTLFKYSLLYLNTKAGINTQLHFTVFTNNCRTLPQNEKIT